MGDIDWSQHTDDEIERAYATVPRIFGPWMPFSFGGGWSRGEVVPGPSWKTGGSVSVQPCTPNVGGFGVSWWNHGEQYENGFRTKEEAMARGDEWLRSNGHRLTDRTDSAAGGST